MNNEKNKQEDLKFNKLIEKYECDSNSLFIELELDK